MRISGVPVGKVKSIAPDRHRRARRRIELESRYAPLPADARAILRPKTLLGETYVELTPGRNSAGTIPEDGKLAAAQVSDTVELDEILRAFDPRTRTAIQGWMQTHAPAIEGRGRDLNDALGNLGAVRRGHGATLVDDAQPPGGRRLAPGAPTPAIVFDALTERDGQLRALIENTNAVFATTAARDEELQAAFRALPTFERESRADLRAAGRSPRDRPLVTQLRPAARELSPTLEGLKDVAPDLRDCCAELRPLIDASEKSHPATGRRSRTCGRCSAQLDPRPRQLGPTVRLHRPLQARADAFFANTVGRHAGRGPGTGLHYLRTRTRWTRRTSRSLRNRLPSNRPNPSAQPDDFDELAAGPTRSTRTGSATRPT